MLLLNDKEIAFGSFPNGETYLPIEGLEFTDYNVIRWVYHDDSEFFKLAMVKHHLDNLGVTTSLVMPYAPHSRMDRANGHYHVSLLTVARFINSLAFKRVSANDPHSAELGSLLSNFGYNPWAFYHAIKVIKEHNFDSIMYPDAGAKGRYKNLNILEGVTVSYGAKDREFKSGEINGLSIRGKVGNNVLIVDDICSRGGTFVEAAKAIRERQPAANVSLMVHYCESNVFTGDMFDYIDKVFVSKDCIYLNPHPRIIKI